MKRNIKNKLREFRDMHKITQAKLAKAVRVSRQSIIAIEKGHYIPSLPLALEISAFFKQNVENIFYLEEAKHG